MKHAIPKRSLIRGSPDTSCEKYSLRDFREFWSWNLAEEVPIRSRGYLMNWKRQLSAAARLAISHNHIYTRTKAGIYSLITAISSNLAVVNAFRLPSKEILQKERFG